MIDNIITELIDIINEDFYLLDVNFDSDYCDIVFNEIHSAFVAAKKESQFRIEMLEFIKNCLLKVERDKEYDYKLFLNNVNLLKLSFLKKQRIISNVQKQTEIKKIS